MELELKLDSCSYDNKGELGSLPEAAKRKNCLVDS